MTQTIKTNYFNGKWNKFHRLNLWYDTLQEPTRMMLVLTIYGVLVILPSILIKEVGFSIGFALFCMVGLYRIHYNHTFPKSNYSND